jgi:hypothetical protein
MKLEAVMNKLIIKWNNRLVRWRRIKVAPEEILLLLPHCLHKQSCPQNVVHSLDECKRCGGCSVGALTGIRDDFGVVACVVGGGRQALAHTRQPEIKAVVAVACEKELVQGIFAAFPKPVLGVVNVTPEGPCKNTLADPNEVIKAIQSLTRKRT